MKAIPEGLTPYRQTPVFTIDTVPPGLLRDHRTKAGVWGVIHVAKGRVRYTISPAGEDVVLNPGYPGVIEPEVPHHVLLLDEGSFYVEFWR